MKSIKIAHFDINKENRPFIVAEAGINHNGELEQAYLMIELAKQAGADAIKFQTFNSEEFVGDPHQTYTYESQGKTVSESMLEMFKRYEFNRDDWFLIRKKCDDEKITFFSTPQNITDLELLMEVGIPAIKIGSDDFTNIPLLREYATYHLPIILSCGMADLAEIYQALKTVGVFDGQPVILLLCTSQYPTPPEDVNLKRLTTLSNAFPEVILGFSDHTRGVLASTMAVALGAVVFEKHFTLNHNLPGPDHWFSADPYELKEWVDAVNTAHTMLGSHQVRPTEKEIINKKEFQRVIVAARNINEGELYLKEMFAMRRMPSGRGLPSSCIDLLLGKTARNAHKKGEIIEI